MLRTLLRVSAVALCLLAAPLLRANSVDDCHSEFAAYVAAKPYIINPSVEARKATTIVAVLEDPSMELPGVVPYRVEVRNASTKRVVFSSARVSDLYRQGNVEGVFTWDGRDAKGRFVEDGEYVIEVSGSLRAQRWTPSIDDETAVVPRAKSTPVSVIVDRAGRYDALFNEKRPIAAQAASIDTTFPYQFFFGTTHAHTNWSDGGMPTTDCASGRYGYAGGAQPVDAFNYAKTSGSVDFIGVVEHNHLMDDACAGCTSQQVIDRYHAGFTAAQTATVPGSFVAMFGMEWGVISGGGHVNIYNQSKLMSWTGEPYDVLVDKSVYSQLYTAVKNNQGTLGSYGSFCHPNTSDYNSFARTADGDATMRAIAMISGPAFNTSTSFSPGGSTYESLYNYALARGWKIGPESHQDNHCWNFGNSTPNRTGVVIPNGTTFNQQSLLAAYANRRIFASQDRNAQLIFRTSDNTRLLGDSFSASGSLSVNVSLRDPDGDGIQKIEIWGGKAGTVAAPGAAPTVLASNTASGSLTASLTAQTTGEEWYYFAKVVEADGDILWSSPMWVTWSGACSVPGTSTLSSPANGATGVATSTTLTWSAASGATSYDVYFGASTTPAFYSNVTTTSLAVSGLTNSTSYSWRVVPKNSCGSAASTATSSFTTAAATCTLPGTTTQSSPAAGATGVATATSLTWSAATGATSYDVYFGTASSPALYTNTTATSVSVSALANNTTYYWRIVPKNACGSAASTATRSFTTTGGVVTLLNEGAESGAPGWTFYTAGGSGWSIATGGAKTGTYGFRTNAAYTTYVNSANWTVTSPAFSLSGRTTATLKYDFKHSTESGYDFFWVEVSKDGGTTWTTLRKVSGLSSGYSAWAPTASIDLTPYVGSANTMIRFKLTSDTSVQDWGVAVDNVLVTAQ